MFLGPEGALARRNQEPAGVLGPLVALDRAARCGAGYRARAALDMAVEKGMVLYLPELKVLEGESGVRTDGGWQAWKVDGFDGRRHGLGPLVRLEENTRYLELTLQNALEPRPTCLILAGWLLDDKDVTLLRTVLVVFGAVEEGGQFCHADAVSDRVRRWKVCVVGFVDAQNGDGAAVGHGRVGFLKDNYSKCQRRRMSLVGKSSKVATRQVLFLISFYVIHQQQVHHQLGSGMLYYTYKNERQ